MELPVFCSSYKIAIILFLRKEVMPDELRTAS